ncbi:MAG TPA: S9 family peptidase [Novosphingobium sp.]|nr:S9 family peptidase [Novosphingobium sp.]
MGRKFLSVAALLLAGAAPVAAWAQDAATLAAKFGAVESVQQISLSPDGNKVALIGPRPGGGQILYVADFTTGGPPKPILNASRAGEHLRWCNWSSDSRLVCGVSIAVNDAGQQVGFSRLIALDAVGGNLILLSSEVSSRSLGYMQYGGGVIDWDVAGKPGTVLMTRQFVPETTRGTNISSSKEGLGVEEVDTTNLKRRVAEQPRRATDEYISDGHGVVRIMGGQETASDGTLRPERNYQYRMAESRDWKPLGTVSTVGVGTGFDPYAVDSAKNLAYGFEYANGFRSLYSVALDGTGTKQLVLSRNDVDIDGLVRIGRDDRVVGATYATERRSTDYFDPELKRLSVALGRALPGQPGISIIDANAGETKLLMLASSDTNPGMFYLYDKATRQLEEVLPVRNELVGVAMGTMKPISFPAADGTQIPAYLTLPPGSDGKGLPTIVMPHGGPGARDEWGFDWLVQFYAARGFAVLQPNFRGSTGYGSAWYQKNGFQSWRTAIGDVNDAGRWLTAQGIAAPGKLAIVGWSYGGYAALQSSVLDPDLYKAIVAIAPVTDLERLRQESVGFTSSALVDRFIGHGPHVREGSPAQNAERIKAPVLLFHGDKDQNVGIGESRLMASKLREAGKTVELVEFPGLDHQLPSSTARARLLTDSDAFLRRSLGLPAN